MKKFLFSLIAMTAFTLAAFQVVEIRDPKSGEGFTSGAGGKLVAVQAFSTNATGTVALSSVWQTALCTNASAVVASVHTNATGTVSNRLSSAVSQIVGDPADFAPPAWSAAHPFEDLIALSTNIVETAVTNVWPVYSRTVAVTNSLVSGSCSANVYSGSPAETTYIKPHEWLIFTGTATGGFLRLILE